MKKKIITQPCTNKETHHIFNARNQLIQTLESDTNTNDETTNFYYLQDHLGSPIRLLGEDGHDDIMAYDELGVPEVTPGNRQDFHNPFGFTGYQTDNITGLYYAQARFYNSTTGRFYAEDPAKDQHNWYGYCGCNPINFVDPSGLFSIGAERGMPHDDEPFEEAGGLGRVVVPPQPPRVVPDFDEAIGDRGTSGIEIPRVVPPQPPQLPPDPNESLMDRGTDGTEAPLGAPVPRPLLSPDLEEPVGDWGTDPPGLPAISHLPENNSPGFISNVVNTGINLGNNIANVLIPLQVQNALWAPPFTGVTGAVHFGYNALGLFGQRNYSDDQERALTQRIANYRGQTTITFGSGTSGASLGPIMILGGGLDPEVSRHIDLLRHEHGHFLEYQELGLIMYYLGIGFMSFVNFQRDHSRDFYTNQPWEIHADILAEIIRTAHTQEARELGELYFQQLQSISGVYGDTGWLRFLLVDMWNFVNHDFSAIRECD